MHFVFSLTITKIIITRIIIIIILVIIKVIIGWGLFCQKFRHFIIDVCNKPFTFKSGNFAFLFNCTPVGRTSDSMMVPT